MGRMQRLSLGRGLMALPAAMSFVLAACSGPDLTQIKVPKIDAGTLVTPNFNEFQKREEARGPVGSSDLVDTSGRCSDPGPARAPDIAGGGQGSEAGAQVAPPSAHPISLKMTECEVVRAVGAPQGVQIGANERGDRAVTIEYRTGDRPGIYRFVDGRLVSIERVGEPSPADKKPPPKKPKQAT
jgi:hypothetical protein